MAGGLGLLESIGVMILTACVIVLVTRRLAVPSIVLYILAGLILGPGLGLFGAEALTDAEGAHDHDPVGVIAEVGIALLLFLVGLELSLERIRDVGKVAVYAGVGHFALTAGAIFGASLLLGFSNTEAIFLCIAFSCSSTVLVVKLLDQKKELHSLYSRIALGVSLVQDLVVILALTFLAGLGVGGAEGGDSVIAGVAQAFGGMAVLLGAALLASKYLLPRPFTWAARSPETLFIWSLFLCFLFSIAAISLNLSPAIGAFLAGLSLAQLGCAGDLLRRVHPLMNFFIIVFFVSLGAQMELAAARDYLAAGVGLLLIVLLLKPLILAAFIYFLGYSRKISLYAGSTVAQVSEFSFIFAAVGLSTGLIDDGILSLVAAVGLVSLAVCSYAISYNHQIYGWAQRTGMLRRLPDRQAVDSTEVAIPPLSGHIVVVGMNALGRRVVELLAESGELVLAVDTDTRKLEGLPAKRLVGSVDYLSVFEEAGIERAKLVISALQIVDTNNLLAYRCKQLGVPVVIHAFDRSVLPDLRRLAVDFHIDSRAGGFRRLLYRLEEEGFLVP